MSHYNLESWTSPSICNVTSHHPLAGSEMRRQQRQYRTRNRESDSDEEPVRLHRPEPPKRLGAKNKTALPDTPEAKAVKDSEDRVKNSSRETSECIKELLEKTSHRLIIEKTENRGRGVFARQRMSAGVFEKLCGSIIVSV